MLLCYNKISTKTAYTVTKRALKDMAAPRVVLSRISSLRVDIASAKDTPRLLILAALVALYSPDDADHVALYRGHRNQATLFLDSCARGDIQPCANQVQTELSRLVPAGQVAHLYIGCWNDTEATHYVSLIRGADGLFRLRHRKIRVAPQHLARDGVFFSWGKITPRPDIACASRPTLDRVLTGGRATQNFLAEAAMVYEVRRQLSHCAMICELFGCLHRGEIVTWHDPGRAVLRVDRAGGEGWTAPYDFVGVSVRPYAQPGTQKHRVTVCACASDAGLYSAQSPRCILASIKGMAEYHPGGPSEGRLLSELVLSRLLPFVGVVGVEGKVSLVGLHYDLGSQQGVVGEFIAGRTLRSCEGIPMVKPVDNRLSQLWLPNAALLTILRGLIYDETPDTEARVERWYALTRVLRWFGVSDPAMLPDYFARCGLPLPAGADDHIAGRVAAEKAYNTRHNEGK